MYIIYYMYCTKKSFSISECPRMSLNKGLCQTLLIHSHSPVLTQSISHTAVNIQQIVHARLSITHVLRLMALSWQHTSAFWQRSARICHNGDQCHRYLLTYSICNPLTRFYSSPLTSSTPPEIQ